MQLQTWSKINRRYFAKGAGPSKKRWEKMVDDGVINGRVLDEDVWIDEDQFAANTVLGKKTDDEIPDLLA